MYTPQQGERCEHAPMAVAPMEVTLGGGPGLDMTHLFAELSKRVPGDE